MKIILSILVALLLDWFIGEPPANIHPVIWMGNWIRFTSEHALHIQPDHKAQRFFYGVFIILLGSLIFGLPVWLLQFIITRTPLFIQILLTALLLKPVLSFRGLLHAGKEIRAALSMNDISEARKLVAWHLVSRDTSELTASQVASAAVESIAENFTDSLITPLFCFVLGGLPLAWIFRLVNTADAMIGYHTDRWEYIGKFAARLDDVLNFIPARISALMICLGSAFAKADMKSGFSVMWAEHTKTSSPNAGWTMSAMAGALHVKLEKLNNYSLNASAAAPQAADIARSTQVIITALVLIMIVMTGLCAISL